MASPDWVWVTVEVAVAAHAEQLAEHGGGEGVRDIRLLESALARPQNLASYGESNAAALAAAYAYGIARNHPFVDGNKRTAAVVSETFLILNGHRLIATDAELVVAFLALAAGELNEEETADWFRQRVQDGDVPSRQPLSRGAESWLEANRTAVEASNAWVESKGLPLKKHRLF